MKLVHGFGVNDSPTNVTRHELIDGKKLMVWSCPFYNVWKGMLKRSYSEACIKKQPAYRGVTVCLEWKSFSAFRGWMMAQDWIGKELDKDLLFPGNKEYKPNACVFIDGITNTFLTDRAAGRGAWPLGVYCQKRDKKFSARCRNPFTLQREHLGLYDCPSKAHLAWKKRKHELACCLADTQADPRVAKALRTRYL